MVLAAALVWIPSASAAIPAGLKSSCTTQNPHPGYSYQFCNDGLPPTGGTTPNVGGVNAVRVPGIYDGYEGLPPLLTEVPPVPGAEPDGYISLDVDISMPTVPAPPGGYPLLFFMHGCCSGSKTSWEATSFDAGGEAWHYSNAWFASRGYVVVNYTARGFVNGELNGNMGSTGYTQLDSRLYEINDFQHLAGQIADDAFFNVNPQKVVATGGSYGGGFSWLALTDPKWVSPGGKQMKLAAVAPKYGWTDLVDSLVHTGRHSQNPGALPPFDGTASTTPTGIPKRSINTALYESGKFGLPPGSAHTTFPPEIDDALICLNSTDPVELNPLCASTLTFTLPQFINDRSAYYQNDFFSKIATDASYRIPVFNAATFTDPLFPPVENIRMSNRLQSVVPSYPIQQYFGDYQHFVQNKAKEWGDLCGGDDHVCQVGDYPSGDVDATPSNLERVGVTSRLNRFIDHYADPPANADEPEPSFNVTASLQICPQNASTEFPADQPGERFTAARFDHLARGTLSLNLTGTQVTVNNAEPNTHALTSDPIENFAANGGRCPVETAPAGAGVATYDSAPLTSDVTMIGATKVSIDYSATLTDGNFQLNARLYDVFPGAGGQAVMVDRGARRVTATSGTVTYELHGNGWRFPAGHSIRIEIAQDDDPYLKASNVVSSATLTGVRLDIPIREGVLPIPTGANTFRAQLVPAFDECTQAEKNSVHGGNLASDDSCSNPSQSSSTATVGTSTTLGTRLGFASVDVCNPPQPGSGICSAGSLGGPVPDVRLRGNGSDVVCRALSSACPGGPGSDYDPNSAAGLYTGNLNLPADSNAQIPTPHCNPSPPNPSSCAVGADMTAVAVIPGSSATGKNRTMRITDRYGSVPSLGDPSSCTSTSSCSMTVRDQLFAVPVVCKATASASIGSYCGANTTANALVPGIVEAGKAAVVELGQLQVFDSGPNGTRGDSDDQLFAVQGIFIP